MKLAKYTKFRNFHTNTFHQKTVFKNYLGGEYIERNARHYLRLQMVLAGGYRRKRLPRQ